MRKQKKFRVYIAGGMHGRMTGLVRAERMMASTLLEAAGLDYYDPAASEGLEDKALTWIIDSNMSRPLMESYVHKDDTNLAKCDAILVLTGDTVSDGTWDEKAQMQYRYKRPIAMVAPRRASGDLMTFTTIKIKGVYPTLEAAINGLKGELNALRSK